MRMTDASEEQLTVREAGRRGGRKVKEQFGREYFARIGEKGGRSLKDARGSEYFSEIGKKGGQAVKSKYGPDHFSQIGQKGGQRVKELVEKGKQESAQKPREIA